MPKFTIRSVFVASLVGSIPFVIIGIGKVFGPEWSLACFLGFILGFVTLLWMSENT